MKKWLLLLMLLAVVAVPASATQINTTLIYVGADYNTHDSGVTRSYFDSAQPGWQFIEESIAIQSDDSPVTFALTYSDGTVDTGTITHVTTGLFSGETQVTLGGKTSHYGYSKVFSNIVNGNTKNIYFVYSTDNAGNCYLSAVPRSHVIDNTNIMYPTGALLALYQGGIFAYLTLDTTTDAYTTVTKPSNDPIIMITFNSQTTDFRVLGSVTTYDAMSTGEAKTKQHVTSGTTFDTINTLIQFIVNVVTAVKDFVVSAATYVRIILYMGSIVFATQVFLTLNAAYIIIHAVLAVHDSDSLFKSLSKFSRAMLKLMKFYADLFKYIKDAIKWW